MDGPGNLDLRRQGLAHGDFDGEELEKWAAGLLGRFSPTTSVWLRLLDSGGLLWHSGDLSSVLGCDAAPYLASRERFLELVHPDDVVVFAQGPAQPGEPARTWRLVRPDGQVRWVRSEVLSVELTDAGPAVVGTITDVTTQVDGLVRTEQLSRAGAWAAGVLDRAGDEDVDRVVRAALGAVAGLLGGVYATAFRMHPSGRFSSQLEWSPGEDEDLMAVQPTPTTVEWFRAAADGTAPVVVGTDTVTPGSPRAYDLVARLGLRSLARLPLALAGDLVGFVVVGSTREVADWASHETEVLERVARSVHAALDRADAQRRGRETFAALLVARDEADRADAGSAAFASKVGHDLRSPAAAVVAAAELLADDVDGATRSPYLGHIITNAQHVLAVLDDLLSLARSEHQAVPVGGPVDVVELARAAMDQSAPQAARSGITLELFGDRSVKVAADPVLVAQVLGNLVSNAVKYNRADGDVAVRVVARGTGAQVVVADTGPGIDPGYLDLLWQPFERLGAQHTDVPGTGLGLAIARHAAQRLGGTVEVVSSSSGSSFTFDLPGVVSAGPVAASWGPVLVVDDNETWREVLARSLHKGLGVDDVRLAGTGAEAVADVAREVPALVVLDRHLPDADGEDVIAQLRAVPGAAGLPVVMVSADMTDESRRRCLQAGAGAYLVKPASVAELREAVSSVLGPGVAVPATGQGATSAGPVG